VNYTTNAKIKKPADYRESESKNMVKNKNKTIAKHYHNGFKFVECLIYSSL